MRPPLDRPSPPLRVPIVGADPPLQRLHLVAVDLLAQEGDLRLQRGLGQIHPPGPRLAVLTVAPAVASAFEGVLVLKGRALGPEPEIGQARPLQEVRQGGAAGGGKGWARKLEGGQASASARCLSQKKPDGAAR